MFILLKNRFLTSSILWLMEEALRFKIVQLVQNPTLAWLPCSWLCDLVRKQDFTILHPNKCGAWFPLQNFTTVNEQNIHTLHCTSWWTHGLEWFDFFRPLRPMHFSHPTILMSIRGPTTRREGEVERKMTPPSSLLNDTRLTIHYSE